MPPCTRRGVIAAGAAGALVPPRAGLAEPFRIAADTSFIDEPEALWALARHERADVETSFGAISTSFCRARSSRRAPKLLFLHGADASFFEWRYLARRLSDTYDCTALDWWGGGWTDRRPIYEKSRAQPTPPRPFAYIAEHIASFAAQQLGPEPIVLVGASLGGAAALDVAARFPERVRALVLVDAGGESYASPPPEIVTAAAPLASSVQRLINQAAVLDPTYREEARLLALHRNEPLWLQTGSEYLRSGSYERVVNPPLVRTIAQPALVVWGAQDPVLNVRDAARFQRDLPNCAGVRVVERAGHSPQLDQPAAVEAHVRAFVEGLA